MSEMIETISEGIRTADIIAAEINGIKEQVRASVLAGAIEIGRRLKEAKAMVPFGAWADWLQDNVDYSERTAQNMMRIADEYGKTDPQALADLTYTQAVLLLGVPSEERDAFVQEHKLEDMTTRELQAAVDELKADKAKMQLTIDQLMEGAEKKDAHKEAQARSEARAAELSQAVSKLEKELAKAGDLEKKAEAKGKKEAEARVAELECELKEARDAEARAKAEIQAEKRRAAEAAARLPSVPPEVEAELTRLRAQASRSNSETELRAAFDAMKDGFERLMNRLITLEAEDEQQAAKYRSVMGKGVQMMADKVSGNAGGA